MSRSRPFIVVSSIIFATLLLLTLKTYAQQNVRLYVYYYPDCFECMERMNNVVLPFYESNEGDIQLILKSLNNQTNQQQFYKDFADDLASILEHNVDSPYIMLRDENKTLRIYGENLTINNLEKALDAISTSNQPETGLSSITPHLNPSTTALVFSAGIFSGINPCLIAFITFMTSASIQIDSIEKHSAILGILARVTVISTGIVVWFLLFGAVFHGIHPIETDIMKSILATVLAVLGITYMISSRNPNSRFFRTPQFLKNFIVSRSKKKSVGFDFILGVGFALAKTPCLVGPYLVILSWLTTNTALATFYIFIFNLGVVVPLFIIAGFLASGVVSIAAINRFRTKERNITRLLTGILLASTAVLLLVF